MVSVEKNVKYMAMHAFLFAMASTTFRIMYPYYLSAEGLDLQNIGWATAIGTGIAAFALPITGYVSDNVGRKPVIISAALMVMTASIVAVIGVNLPLAVLGQLLFMISFNIGNPARNALIADSVPISRIGAAFGFIATFFSLARVITPYPAGLIAEHFGYGSLFTINSIIALTAAVIALLLLKETIKKDREKVPRDIKRELLNTIKPLPSEKGLLSFLVMDRFAWSLWISLLSPYLRTAYGLSPSEVGLLMTIVDIVGVLTQYFMGKIADIRGAWQTMILSEISGIIVALTLAIRVPFPYLYLTMIFLGIAISSWIPGYSSFLSQIVKEPSLRGRVFARANFYRGLSASPASGLGGYLFDRVGLSAPLNLSVILLLFAIAFFMKKVRKSY